MKYKKHYWFPAHEPSRAFSELPLNRLLKHKRAITIMNEHFDVNPICMTPWDGRHKGVGFNMLIFLKKSRAAKR